MLKALAAEFGAAPAAPALAPSKTGETKAGEGAARGFSREAPVAGGEAVLRDVVADDGEQGAAVQAAMRGNKAAVVEVLETLPEMERAILSDRYGFGGEAPMTLETIGRRMGVTRERVRQIEAGALLKLRAGLRSRGVDSG